MLVDDNFARQFIAHLLLTQVHVGGDCGRASALANHGIAAYSFTMPFANSHDADVRLVGNANPLTNEEIRDLMPYMRVVSEGGYRRLHAELALQQLQMLKRQEDAITKFDRASSRLAKAAIAVSIAQVVVAVIALIIANLRR